MKSELFARLDAIFKPCSVGAGSNPAKWGGRMFVRLMQSSFKGAVFPINPNHEEILGQKSYRSLAEIEAPVDLVVLCLPASKIPGLLSECIAKGIRGAVIVTADFAGGNRTALLEAEVAHKLARC